MIDIEFIEEDRNVPEFNQEHFCYIVNDLFKEHRPIEGSITYVFGSDEWLLEQNKTYLSHDYYTDIITFDLSDEELCSDILISLDRIKENANDVGVSFMDELLRVLFHGVLHLVGFNDKDVREIQLMRAMEEKYVNLYKNYVSRGT